MANGAFGLVPQAIQGVSRTISDIGTQEASSRVARAKLGLETAKVGMSISSTRKAEDLAERKHRLNVWLKTPSTIKATLMSHPGLSPEKKKMFQDSDVFKAVQDMVMTPETLISTIKEHKRSVIEDQKRRATEEFRTKQLEVQAGGVDVQREKVRVSQNDQYAEQAADARQAGQPFPSLEQWRVDKGYATKEEADKLKKKKTAARAEIERRRAVAEKKTKTDLDAKKARAKARWEKYNKTTKEDEQPAGVFETVGTGA